jgi:hypothetical protein
MVEHSSSVLTPSTLNSQSRTGHNGFNCIISVDAPTQTVTIPTRRPTPDGDACLSSQFGIHASQLVRGDAVGLSGFSNQHDRDRLHE